MARLLRIYRSCLPAFCAVVLLAAACGGGDPAGVATTSAPTTSEFVDPVPINAIQGAAKAEIVETLRSSVDALYAMPVRIETTLVEDGVPVEGAARIDRVRGLADSTEKRTVDGATITTRNVLAEGRAFLKSTTGPEAEAALTFTELGYEPFGPEFLDQAFTAFGRLGPSLDRIVMLLEELPFAAQTRSLGGGEELSVVVSPFAIADFYARTGLEAVGGRIDPQPTRFSFRIEEGILTGIVADGTHFHDGEALEVSAAIMFTPISPFEVERPDVEE